jgi:TPR repeat protein
MLFNDNAAPGDESEAIRLWTLAADKGEAYAQLNLAQMYATGTGVPRDLRRAQSLFILAGKTLDVSKRLHDLSMQLGETETVKSESQPDQP